MPTADLINDIPAAAAAVAPFHAVVVLPDHTLADDPVVWSELARHTSGRYVPYPTYPLHGTGRRPSALWNLTRRPDGVTVVAGGPRHRLDLQALASAAGWQAQQRWQAWKAHVAAGTPQARDWESLLTSPAERNGRRLPALSLGEARARFEAQPRVLAMLAINSQRILPFWLDPYDLAAFQAGEQVYCTLAAQQAVVGQLLVLPGGLAYRPVTTSTADRLRYLRAALDVVPSPTPTSTWPPSFARQLPEPPPTRTASDRSLGPGLFPCPPECGHPMPAPRPARHPTHPKETHHASPSPRSAQP